MPSFLVDLLARLNRWPRRLAALACLALAVASALAARHADAVRLSHGAADTPVVVATRDLGVGTTIRLRDLTTVAWPRSLVPVGATSDPEGLVGRRLAGPLRTREAVTSTRLVGADLTAGLAAGDVATAVAVNAALATVLHAGDRVDILAGPADVAEPAARSTDPAVVATLIAEGAAVLALLPATDADGVSGAAQVLVVTDRRTAVRLVALQSRGALAVVLSPP